MEDSDNLINTKPGILRPYFFEYNISDEVFSYNYYEHLDLYDLKRARIKEVTIREETRLTKKTKFDLTNLLSNVNIQKINLKLYYYSSKFLLFMSKQLRKNTTIKEIRLESYLIEYLASITPKRVLVFFINSISSRLVEIINIPFPKINTEMNKLIFSNPNLKVIRINYSFSDSNILKYILSSDKVLDKISNLDKIIPIDKWFFDDFSKSKVKVIINTLHLESSLQQNIMLFIEYSFLFKTDTIRFGYSFKFNKEIIDSVLKLSNNPLNTVKRIIIDSKWDISFKEIISELLHSSDQYNLQRIPKLFYGYREIIINYDTITKMFISVKEYRNSMTSVLYLFKFKDNSFDERMFKDLLNKLFNDPLELRKLKIEYNMEDVNHCSTNPQIVINKINNAQAIVSKMKEIYSTYKLNNIHYKKPVIISLTFDFNKYCSELNVFYFPILEIMMEMKIRIEKLVLINASFTELADFFIKHKALESLNINNIKISINKIEKEDVDKVCQCSHLIDWKNIHRI